MPNWKKVITSGSNASLSKLSIYNTDTVDPALYIETDADSGGSGPILTFKRVSASPANSDYLAQIKFKGENDADQDVTYAKISGKIQDKSDGSEDGIIEFANKKAGSNNITARLKSDKLELINGTNLEVNGTSTFTGDQTFNGDADFNGSITGLGNFFVNASTLLYNSSGATITFATNGSMNIGQTGNASQTTVVNGASLTVNAANTTLQEVEATGAITASNLNIADKTIYIDGDGDVNIGEQMDQIDLIVDGNLVAGFLGDPYVIETNVTEGKVDINGKLRQLVSNTATSSITFADTTTFADNGRLSYNQSNDEMSFWTNGSKRTTINATGEVSSSAFVGDGSGLTGRAYRESISGATSYAITHSLNEDYPIVQVYSSSRAMVIPAEVITTSANAFDISFSSTFDGTVVVKK